MVEVRVGAVVEKKGTKKDTHIGQQAICIVSSAAQVEDAPAASFNLVVLSAALKENALAPISTRLSISPTLPTHTIKVVIRVLVPGEVAGEPTLHDTGAAVLEIDVRQVSEQSFEREVVFAPSGKASAFLLTVRGSFSVVKPVLVVEPTMADEAYRKFLSVAREFWNLKTPSGRTTKQRNGTDRSVPSAEVEPLVDAVYDIEAPFFDQESSGLPSWHFANLFVREDEDVLRHMAYLACARLGFKFSEMVPIANVYLQSIKTSTGDPDKALELVEILAEACKVPSTFVTYKGDVSTDASHTPCERYSTSPKCGAAGDCEDVAKLIQLAWEAFAESTEKRGIVGALADLARRYVAGVCLVAAKGAQFSEMEDGTDTSVSKTWDALLKRRYDDFLSHMVCVVIPLAQVDKRGSNGLRAARDERSPFAEWETETLPTLLLEGTGLKSAFADTGLQTGWERNGLQKCTGSLSGTHGRGLGKTSDFYSILTSFSARRGLAIDGVTVNQAFFVYYPSKASQVIKSALGVKGCAKQLRGVPYTDFVRGTPVWGMRAVHPESSRFRDGLADVKLRARASYVDRPIKYPASFDSVALELTNDVVKPLLPSNFTITDRYDVPLRGCIVVFVNGSWLRGPKAGSVWRCLANAAGKRTKAFVAVELMTVNLWGVRVWWHSD
jgi:hypothetical protein